MIHIAMPWAEMFGWGTCGKHLIEEFAKRGPCYFSHPDGDDVSVATEMPKGARYVPELTANLDMPLLQAAGVDLAMQTKYRGNPNVAYIFSEWTPITEVQKENLRAFDILIAGSEWNAQVIRDAGFECAAVPQGVDTSVFHPMDVKLPDRESFVIFSGGKWEHRKAQDLVLKAVKVMQQRHADVHLVASWQNLWSGEDGYAEAEKQGVRFSGYPIFSRPSLARLMNLTDVGLFPNRCEGGTNLVMMEYLACGKPVVASITTGQKDVLKGAYSFGLGGSDEQVLDQSITGLEYLYQHREEMRYMGGHAAGAMKHWTWARTAEGIAQAMERVGVAA